MYLDGFLLGGIIVLTAVVTFILTFGLGLLDLKLDFENFKKGIREQNLVRKHADEAVVSSTDEVVEMRGRVSKLNDLAKETTENMIRLILAKSKKLEDKWMF